MDADYFCSGEQAFDEVSGYATSSPVWTRPDVYDTCSNWIRIASRWSPFKQQQAGSSNDFALGLSKKTDIASTHDRAFEPLRICFKVFLGCTFVITVLAYCRLITVEHSAGCPKIGRQSHVRVESYYFAKDNIKRQKSDWRLSSKYPPDVH
nr:hypothetical protein [Noviherbaspirillum galbum]